MKPDESTGTGKKFRISDRINSFRYAFSGISILFRNEHNARIHLVIFLVVMAASVLFRISTGEWLAVIIVSGLVFISECFNSAVEYISDQITAGRNNNIKKAKDIAAAGVLIAAAVSVMAGLIIFLPRVAALFRISI